MYAVIAAAAAICSLGPTMYAWGHVLTRHGPYEMLVRVVPGMDGMRVPARFAIVVVAVLAVLAAYGTRAVLARLRPSARPYAVAVIVMALGHSKSA